MATPALSSGFHIESLYANRGCKNCCLCKPCLRKDPWGSFWERLWASSSCESLCDSEVTNGDHGGESMRQLSHGFGVVVQDSGMETMCRLPQKEKMNELRIKMRV